ncbi:hypothetical protein D9M68_614970 [compost metagenome]
MAINQRIELHVRQPALLGEHRQQRNGPVEVKQLRGQTPGMLARRRIIAEPQQTNPIIERFTRVASPLAEPRHLPQQRCIVRA